MLRGVGTGMDRDRAAEREGQALGRLLSALRLEACKSGA